MIKAIFFDSGGVLAKEGYGPGISKYELKHKIPKGKLYESAHDRPYWKQYSLGYISEEDYYKKIRKDFKGEIDTNELKETIYQNFISNIELLDFIKTLKSKFILGLISNNPKEWFKYCGANFGWDNLFGVKIASSEVHIRKPDPKIFKLALKKAKVKGEEAIYIDDRPDRVQGAKDNKMNIIIYKDVDRLRSDISTFLIS